MLGHARRVARYKKKGGPKARTTRPTFPTRSKIGGHIITPLSSTFLGRYRNSTNEISSTTTTTTISRTQPAYHHTTRRPAHAHHRHSGRAEAAAAHTTQHQRGRRLVVVRVLRAVLAAQRFARFLLRVACQVRIRTVGGELGRMIAIARRWRQGRPHAIEPSDALL